MSKITTIAYKNDVLSLRLDDGFTFLVSSENTDKKCPWGILYKPYYKTIHSMYTMFDDGVLRSEIDTSFAESPMKFHSSTIATKLADGNYEVCNYGHGSLGFEISKPEFNITECVTAYKDKTTDEHQYIFAYVDFYNNHEAYRADLCTLLITYKNCTEIVY